MQNIICEAIANRFILELNYGGGKRQVEPYCYGVNFQGKEVLNAYQINGYSRSKKPAGWKTFTISNASAIHLTQSKFSTINSKYNEKNPHFMQIYCRVTLD